MADAVIYFSSYNTVSPPPMSRFFLAASGRPEGEPAYTDSLLTHGDELVKQDGRGAEERDRKKGRRKKKEKHGPVSEDEDKHEG